MTTFEHVCPATNIEDLALQGRQAKEHYDIPFEDSVTASNIASKASREIDDDDGSLFDAVKFCHPNF